MMLDRYILNAQGQPVPEPDLMVWAHWMGTGDNRVVKRECLHGSLVVSTIFLGIDHNYGMKGPPVLWETMVFSGKHGLNSKRCAGSREQAEAMHEEMVEHTKAHHRQHQ